MLHAPRRSVIGSFVGLCTLLTTVSVAGSSAVAAATDTNTAPVITVGSDVLSIGPGKPATPLPAAIVGGNSRWVNDEMGMWDPQTGAPHPTAVAAAKGAHLDMVRYPGGTIANMFDFTHAIGPEQARRCQTGAGFVGGRFSSADSDYGPDENQKFVDTFGGESMIMVPTINESAKDAADFVEYMNAPLGTNPNGGIAWAARRAANGHPAPYGIKVWEVGNEPYLPNQRYWRSPDPQTKLTQFIEGGWQRQTADSAPYKNNDGLFSGCDLADPVTGNGQKDQVYRTRYRPIALAKDSTAESGPIQNPVLTVNGELWHRVDSVHNARRDAKVYEVEQASGEIRFGDGAHGAIPPAGATFSIEYTTGRQDGFLDYYRAIKAVDPSVSVCAGWGKQEFVDAMGNRPYDCIGYHMYTGPAAGDQQNPRYSWDQLYQELLGLAPQAVTKLTDLKNDIAAHVPDPAKRPFLAVTEYGTLSKRGPTGARMPHDFGASLLYSLYITELSIGQIKNGVQLATMSNLNAGPRAPGKPSGTGGVIGGAPNFFVTDASQVINLVHRTVGSTAVVSSVTGNPTATGGDYPALQQIAMRGEDGTIRVLVVNADIQQPMTARVDLPASSGDRQVTTRTWNGPSINTYNTYDDMDNLTTTVSQGKTNGSALDHTFPAHSVTLLEVHPA